MSFPCPFVIPASLCHSRAGGNPAISIDPRFHGDDNAFTIRIMDINGKEIYSQNVNEVNGEFQKQFDFSSYAKGIYLVEIISKKESITKRILIN